MGKSTPSPSAAHKVSSNVSKVGGHVSAESPETPGSCREVSSEKLLCENLSSTSEVPGGQFIVKSRLKKATVATGRETSGKVQCFEMSGTYVN